MPLPQRDSQALGLGLCAGRGGQLAGPRRLQTVAGNPQTFLRGPGRAGRAGAALLPLPPPSSPGWGLHACPPPQTVTPGRAGAFGCTVAPRSDACTAKAPGSRPGPVSHRSAPTRLPWVSTHPAPGLLDQQPEMARGLGGGGEPGGFPSACRKAPVGHATAFRPLSAAKCGSAGGRGCRPELVLRPVAGLGRQPFPPLQGRPGPGRTRPGGRPSVLRGPGHGPGAHTASLPGTSAGQTRKSRPGGRAGGRPRCFLLRRPRPPESIKRGICSASRLPQSGHYAFLSPPLGATYCLLGTWGPEAEPCSGHRLGPGWLFPRGRPVPGGEGESRRQAGWTLGPVSRGCRHKPPRARWRQTAGVCSLTVRSPLPLPGPRSLWSWGSWMSFPSLRDSGHWVWHPP